MARDTGSEAIALSTAPAQDERASVSPAPPELRPVTRHRQTLVLISGFLTICFVVGFNQSYGVFQGYYTSKSQTMLPSSAANSGALLAFIGTLGSGLTWGG